VGDPVVIYGDLVYAVFVSESWRLKEKFQALSRHLGSKVEVNA